MVCEDNQGAKAIPESARVTSNLKLVAVRMAHVREQVSSGVIKIEYLCTADMTADLLTKDVRMHVYVYVYMPMHIPCAYVHVHAYAHAHSHMS